MGHQLGRRRRDPSPRARRHGCRGCFGCVDGCNHSVYIGGRKILRNHYTKDLNHDMSSEEYMRTRLMKKNCLPLRDVDIPLSKRWINNGGCSS